MSDAFLGEIRMFSINFAPKGWAFCNGQLLPINQNQALFSLLGTTYGGDGQQNFALPNLRGRVPIHFGRGHTQGEVGGQESHTVTLQELPTHTHSLSAASNDANLPLPAGNFLARQAPANPYATPNNLGAMNPGSVSNVGASQPHENRQPFLAISFCIVLSGIFPSRN